MTNYKKRNYLRYLNQLVCLWIVPVIILRFIYDVNWPYTIGITSMFVACHIASKLGESLINDWYDNYKNSTDTPFHSKRIKR